MSAELNGRGSDSAGSAQSHETVQKKTRRRKRHSGFPGETCVCGANLPADRRLRICAKCSAKKSAEWYACHSEKHNKLRAKRRKEQQSLTNYAERDLAYERTGFSRGWLKKTPCPCGSSEETALRITRDRRPEANGAILGCSWECEACALTRLLFSKAPTSLCAPGDAPAAPVHSEQERADESHQYRRERIGIWIAALEPEARSQVEAAAARMRNPTIPQLMWANSILARDAAIKAYGAIVGSYPKEIR